MSLGLRVNGGIVGSDGKIIPDPERDATVDMWDLNNVILLQGVYGQVKELFATSSF